MSCSASAARVEELVFVFDLWDFEFDENCNLYSHRGISAIFSLDFRCHFRTNLEAVSGFANHMLISASDQAANLIFALVFVIFRSELGRACCDRPENRKKIEKCIFRRNRLEMT